MTREQVFVAEVMAYYQASGRHDLPWRMPDPDGSFDPYKILVSEVMLQQTQVPRVIPKFEAFLSKFPNVRALADAPLDTVLGAWLGLGYNLRARYLWLAAQQLAKSAEPWTFELLVACKGIGPNTASAVLVYSYDAALTFIETNIRSVIIHHFFEDADQVSDKQVLTVFTDINAYACAAHSPREWYWALMDYGTHLKKTHGNASRRSSSHTKQSKFEGSRRQLRGRILRTLHDRPRLKAELSEELADERFDDVIAILEREGLVQVHDKTLMLYNGFDDVT